MIYIKVVGLDQFIVGRISREYTDKLANLFEVSADEINFISPSCMIFHKGVEQTSWHVLVNVLAPKKVCILQDQAADLIKAMFKNVTINIDIIFSYYSSDDLETSHNDEYPRYIADENIVNDDVEFEDVDDEDIYDGDIFASVADRLK